MSVKYDVCIIGMGRLGTVLGLCFAKQGKKVIGLETNQTILNMLNEGKSPFVEEGIGDLLINALKAETFCVTDSAHIALKSSQIIMIAVSTPGSEGTGEPDFTDIGTASRTIGKEIRNIDHIPIIVVCSTVLPGTTRNFISRIISEMSGKQPGIGFHIACNPEFLREGCAIKDFYKTGRIVIGAETEEAARAIESLYEQVDGSYMHVSIESAEFSKYVDNSWHALKISFANEIGHVCRSFGGNTQETIKIFLADDKLNLSSNYLNPGFAFGGSCLPKDTKALAAFAAKNQVKTPVINSILPSNEVCINHITSDIIKHNPRKVCILGLAFKENVDDLRNSSILKVASKLLKSGIEIVLHDQNITLGKLIPLPGTNKKLPVSPLEQAIAEADVFVKFHNIKIYNDIESTTDKPVIKF